MSDELDPRHAAVGYKLRPSRLLELDADDVLGGDDDDE